jgi:hypothetical protein
MSRCLHAHAAAVSAHRRGLDAGARMHVSVPTRATTRSPAWRGQGQAFGSLSRLTSLELRPATGRDFAAEGKSFLPGSASTNWIPFLRTRSGARVRQPGRRLAHLERN